MIARAKARSSRCDFRQWCRSKNSRSIQAIVEELSDEWPATDDHYDRAGAILELMKEPTPEMLDAGVAVSGMNEEGLAEVYRAMIDAALG